MTSPRSATRPLLAVFGLAVGGTLLWLVLRDVELADLRATAAAMNGHAVLLAAGLYWVSIALRIARWQALLAQLNAAPLALVGESLLVGYAANSVIPARLGEFVRAAYARRRLHTSLIEILGSIVIERALDLTALVLCLGGALALMQRNNGVPGLGDYEFIAMNAAALIALALLAVGALRYGAADRIPLPRLLAEPLRGLQRGLASLNRISALAVIALTAGIWLFEAAAVKQMFAAFDVSLSAPQTLLLMGATALSTLVPTAPAYLGTYQFVYASVIAAFGFAASAGIVVATAIQIVFLGSVALCGAIIVASRWCHHLLRAR